MIDLKLNVGERWEIAGEEHVLDGVLGDGLLHFRSVRTAGPYQVETEDGSLVSPSMTWLKSQLAEGIARRLDWNVTSAARRLASQQEDDLQDIQARDPRARVRQIVLCALDRLPAYSRSDQGLHRALATIWASNPNRLSGESVPAPSTVRGWLKDRGGPGERTLRAMVSMTGRAPRRKRLAASVRSRLEAHAILYWADPRVSIGDVQRLLKLRFYKINDRLARRGIKAVQAPSAETVRRAIRDIECWETVAAKFGTKEANKRFKPCGVGLRANRPLLLGAIDHTVLDCHIVVEESGSRLLGRPTFTALIDVHSRCLVGWLLSFEPPSLYSVMECIKFANRPKLSLPVKLADYPELADIFGRFDEIVVDNEWEFAGVSFESAMADVGTSVRWAPIASPTYKAVIERFFGTLNTTLNQKLPGGTYPPAKLKEWGLDPRHDAVLTLAQVQRLIELAISTYHLERHRGLGDSPARTWMRGVRQHGIPVIGDDRQLSKMLGVQAERTLSTCGVSIFDLPYHDPRIVGPLLEKLASKQPVRGRRKGSATAGVKIKYNPSDISEIYVWDPFARLYRTLPCASDEDLRGVSLWLHRKRAEWRAEDARSSARGEVERRAQLGEEMRSAAPARETTRQKKAALRLSSSETVARLAGSGLRVEVAAPRHDGMAPVVVQSALAPHRTDDSARPVRPARGGNRKAKPSSRTTLDAGVRPVSGDFPNFETDDGHWEDFS